MHGRMLQAAAVVMMLAVLVTGCTSQAYNIGMAKDKENSVVDTGFSVSTVGSYDSADTAVVMAVDQENNCVIFMNMDTGRQYTLYYDGTTYVTDKYDGPMSISQIRAGDVVDVNFLKGKRQIARIKVSPSAWVYENIENYDLGGINKTASIGSNTYALPDEAVVLSEGKRVEVMDVVAQDLVTIRGIDHKIYSINIERGHGYLRLRNEQALLGGWIEVGNTVIREITEGMLLVVPEGSYQVALSNGGVSSTKDIVIERDKETVLDVGDIEIIKDKTGKILFSVTPAEAEATIDGKPVDISSAVELPYGIHQVCLEAEGYDSLTKYIQVGSEYAKISFSLEKKKEDTSTVSENTLDLPDPAQPTQPAEPESVSENTIAPSQSNKVYIDSPKNVEVYVDGNYIGIAPVSFKKTVGSHTVTLRKSGYKTKSYTIYLYDDGEDITYSFVDLEKENVTVSGNASTSTSTTSSKTSSSGSTENPSGSSTENPSGSSTGNPSGGSSEIPSGGSTENPSGGSSETPSGGSTGSPSGGSSEIPSGGSTENPSGGSSGTPSGGSTGNPSGGSSETPSGGSTENPSGGSSETPSGGSTGIPSEGSSETPSGGSGGTSSEGSSGNPSGGNIETPSGENTEAPSGGGTGTAPDARNTTNFSNISSTYIIQNGDAGTKNKSKVKNKDR